MVMEGGEMARCLVLVNSKPDGVLGIPTSTPPILQKNILSHDSAKKIRSICI